MCLTKDRIVLGEDRSWRVRKCDHASFDEWLIDTTSWFLDLLSLSIAYGYGFMERNQ